MFWDRQVDIIEEHVQDALKKGARLLAGGRRNPNLKGLYYEATVLADCNHNMLVMREETFGPVVCIQKVRDEAEAVIMANDSPYGLNGTVFAKDKEKAYNIALQMDTGSVCVNDIAVKRRSAASRPAASARSTASTACASTATPSRSSSTASTCPSCRPRTRTRPRASRIPRS